MPQTTVVDKLKNRRTENSMEHMIGGIDTMQKDVCLYFLQKSKYLPNGAKKIQRHITHHTEWKGYVMLVGSHGIESRGFPSHLFSFTRRLAVNGDGDTVGSLTSRYKCDYNVMHIPQHFK